jgi:hypothetical protein
MIEKPKPRNRIALTLDDQEAIELAWQAAKEGLRPSTYAAAIVRKHLKEVRDTKKEASC